MLVRLKQSQGFMSLIAVCSTKKCSLQEKETFYVTNYFERDDCCLRDALVFLDDLSAVTGTETGGRELCVGRHSSRTGNTNNSLFLNFTRSRRLRIAGS